MAEESGVLKPPQWKRADRPAATLEKQTLWSEYGSRNRLSGKRADHPQHILFPAYSPRTQTQMSLTAHKAYPEQAAQVAPGKRQAALLEKLPIDMCELVAAVVPTTDLLPLALTCHALHPWCVARAKTERVNWVVHKSIGMATLKRWLLRDRMSRLHESMPPPALS